MMNDITKKSKAIIFNPLLGVIDNQGVLIGTNTTLMMLMKKLM